jgi:hypothetical protein
MCTQQFQKFEFLGGKIEIKIRLLPMAAEWQQTGALRGGAFLLTIIPLNWFLKA